MVRVPRRCSTRTTGRHVLSTPPPHRHTLPVAPPDPPPPRSPCAFQEKTGRSASFMFDNFLSHTEALQENSMARPFISNLAFRCIGDCSAGDVEYVPWVGEGALLFIDLSGYSKISAALANKVCPPPQV